MSVLIVGGDHLGSIPRELDKIGVTEIRHITGRSGQKIRDGIPETMDFIIVLYDFVNHNLASKIKNFGEKRKIPIVYAKRSWSSIYQKMRECRKQLAKVGLQVLLH
ncbi:MAG: DUF2325 domain-containing protein [Planctomycetia bacterium]|uniref:Dihydroorotate dehydrogenase n=1 Tax=Candidatus Brocadia sapporoensis TaxID=392547 RepID=A0A1V6LYJ7_9BACT|nr:DUF2325 domain-containing protein [Candidatus Brocadia sapporoensis]MCC7238513.1 DUF2325 domain-containing protein [Candidatus Brocadia sp.]MEB2309004.1 DUF2325 domain-containing protein [Candidatus Brocadiaceae bacterium]OQZ04072.1 MAG: dihydroorotate dehydrogenase [Candidatus Brocadia sp. UTAMX1]QOJ07163.1 MAG: DUF2325 domain-containing protein [Planctomycetia bacterium]RZV57799.1 MAG: DUF2325 domain-containing protein [Candidatus Brocadia sp. BROELEC01]TVL96388.1 MAG: DUF2325 domain-con